MPKDERRKTETSSEPASETSAAGAGELEQKGRHFPAAPIAKSVEVGKLGWVELVLIADLGFRIYHEINVSLLGVRIPYRNDPERYELVKRFTSEWIKNGAPAQLDVFVQELVGSNGYADVRRIELEPETFKPIGRGSLAHALVEQGLAEWIS